MFSMPGWANSSGSIVKPKGEIILVVTGDIAKSNRGDAAVFDLEMLREIGETDIVTSTIWTEGKNRWTGIILSDLLDFLGIQDGTVRAIALNDYFVDLPVDDPIGPGPIIAFARNGERLTVRDKGPLWLIYPFDDVPDYHSALYFSRSVWQLSELEIDP
jgi:hypothetical protein